MSVQEPIEQPARTAETKPAGSGNSLRERRTLTIILAGCIVALLAIAVAVSAFRGTSDSTSADPALKRTAQALLPPLQHAPRQLPIKDGSLTSFQAWFYDLKLIFDKNARRVTPANQVSQVLLVDPDVLPPQYQGININGKPAVANVPLDVVKEVISSHSDRYVTVTLANIKLRGYLVALPVPTPLQPDIGGVLEVFQVYPK